MPDGFLVLIDGKVAGEQIAVPISREITPPLAELGYYPSKRLHIEVTCLCQFIHSFHTLIWTRCFAFFFCKYPSHFFGKCSLKYACLQLAAKTGWRNRKLPYLAPLCALGQRASIGSLSSRPQASQPWSRRRQRDFLLGSSFFRQESSIERQTRLSIRAHLFLICQEKFHLFLHLEDVAMALQKIFLLGATQKISSTMKRKRLQSSSCLSWLETRQTLTNMSSSSSVKALWPV